MEKYLIQLILKYAFYNQYKSIIIQEYFPDNLQKLYNLIIEKHEQNKKDIAIDELKALYKVTYPTTTRAQWNLLEEILDNLPGELSQDVAQEVLQKAFILEQGRQIAQIGIDIVNGKQIDVQALTKIINKVQQGELSSGDDLQQVSSELEDILEAATVATKWSFNLRDLQTVCGGTGPGIFIVAGARPEAGKTCFAVSNLASPGGFCDQGAVAHYYANEEHPQRIQARAVMSWTGMTLQEILLYPDKVKKIYSQIRDKLKFFDCRGRSIYEIEKHISKGKPDIAVIDQLDKLSVNGSFAREDERLGELYIHTRDICNTYELSILALNQVNAEAEGKNYISSANMSNSRTSKAAEADILLGIGKSPQHDEYTRVINIIKNKVKGLHNDVVCMIRPEISRYTM